MESKEARIVRLILEDLCGRQGFDSAYDSCDEGIQNEIRDALREIVREELK